MPRICLARDITTENHHTHEILFYFDIADVYTAINAHWLKIQPEHDQLEGYFGNSLQSIINAIVYDCHVGKLDLSIGGIDSKKRFVATGAAREGKKAYTYFLPKDKVTWLEPKEDAIMGYRFYKDVGEALDNIPLDPLTHLRLLRTRRDEWHPEEPTLVKVSMGGVVSGDEIILNGVKTSLHDLYENYERLDKDGWWRPCGVRESLNDTEGNSSMTHVAYDYDMHLQALDSWD